MRIAKRYVLHRILKNYSKMLLVLHKDAVWFISLLELHTLCLKCIPSARTLPDPEGIRYLPGSPATDAAPFRISRPLGSLPQYRTLLQKLVSVQLAGLVPGSVLVSLRTPQALPSSPFFFSFGTHSLSFRSLGFCFGQPS